MGICSIILIFFSQFLADPHLSISHVNYMLDQVTTCDVFLIYVTLYVLYDQN